MKKISILFLFLLTLLTCGANGQYQQYQKQSFYYPNPGSVSTINITLNQVQNGWGQMGNTCAGCASVFYQIIRTTQAHMAEDGNYYYFFYVYFYSNSYYTNGQLASTYLTNIRYFADNQMILQTPYFLVKPGVQEFGAWIRSPNPSCYVQFQLDQITVY